MLTRLSLVLALAAAALPLGGGTPAPSMSADIIHMVETYCVATRGDAAGSLALAERDGFRPSPDSDVVVRDYSTPGLSGVEGRSRRGVAGTFIFASGHMETAAGPTDFCLVGVIPGAAAADLETAAQTWLDVEASDRSEGNVTYTFVETPRGHTSAYELSRAEALRATNEGRIRLLVVRVAQTPDEDIATITYGAISGRRPTTT